MCGIAGIIDLDDRPIDPAVLLSMSRVIAHRGPDDEGYVLLSGSGSGYRSFSGVHSVSEIRKDLPVMSDSTDSLGMNLGLCHRRFSIIDLSHRGHQPFIDWEKRCCLICNGEVFNYLELREELERKGHRFFSTSDTEVLAEAYKAWGPDCFARLNGFWAVALFDFETRRFILSRDRLGKKPLYWTRKGGRVYFASEIKAILQAPEIKGAKNKVNEEAAFYWLEYGFRDFSNSTFFEGIFCLPPASWTFVDNDFPGKINIFWTMPDERMKEKEIGVSEACAKLRETLEDAVRIRLRADVPWSIELSGGMDSSSLVALASQFGKEKIHVVTVRFPEKEWNEEPFARSIAERCNADYHVLDPPVANAWQRLAAFTYLHEEPYHSPNFRIGQLYWSMMREEGRKISLQGTGGDELFAGYNYYFPFALYEALKKGRIGHLLNNLIHWSEYRPGVLPNIGFVFHFLRTLVPAVRIKHKLRNYIKIKSQTGIGAPFKSFNDALINDMTKTKMNYWLLSYDKNSMGIPIEVRSPLLDFRVVELACSLPMAYLIKDGWHKWIFRKAMEGILPGDVVWRKQKMGFPFPYERLMANSEPMIEMIYDRADNPFLDFSKQEFFRTNWYFISFILWYEMFINNNQELFHELNIMSNDGNPFSSFSYLPEFLNGVTYW